MAWTDENLTLNLVYGTHIQSGKKSNQSPVTVISQLERNPILLIDEPASKWQNDAYMSSGAHHWSLFLPVLSQEKLSPSLQSMGFILGTLFLEFPTPTAWSLEELSQLSVLCVQAIASFRSVLRKQQVERGNQDLRIAREQLFTYSRTLEQKIRMRTLELLEQTYVLRAEVSDRIRAQEESVALQRRAEHALLVKEQFLATMSHELRTPFNGVMGMIQLLEDTELSSQQREYLSELNAASMHLLNLLNDILDYTKIESGQLEFHQCSLSIRDICESVIDDHFEKADDLSIDLAYISENNHIDRIIADPVRLRQLIRSYVENAIKFNQNRGGYILLTSHMSLLKEGNQEFPPKYRLSVSCADTGPGISDVGGLFIPFSQVDSSMSRRHGGTGLGLAICKRLVELLNGDAWCHSVVGQGSTFYFNMVIWLEIHIEIAGS
jgi:signal transduction histidine kinase